MRNLRRLILPSILTTTAIVLPGSLRATEPETSTSSKTESSTQVEEITVTARRIKENLQNTPVAVSAFSTAALESRSMPDAIGLQQFVPNLNSTKGFSGGSYANFFIRGVGQADQVTGVDPGVALYIDGVYLGRANGADIATLDLERVEVLRGPQGTLFGKNTLGGAINVLTRAPTNDLDGAVKIIGGSRNWAELRGWINVPLVDDKLMARIAVDAKTQDGYGYRMSDAHRFGDIRTESVRGQLLYKPRDGLSFNLQGDYLHTRGTANMVKLHAIGALGFIPAGYDQYAITSESYRTNSGFDPGNSLDVGGVSLTGDWDIGSGIALKSITAYRKLRQKTGTDFDGGPQRLIDQQASTRQHQFSQEVQLNGALLDDRLTFVMGGYYYNEKADQAITLYAFTPAPLNQVSLLKIENLAAFGQATYRFTDAISVTAGLRYTHEKKNQLSRAFFLRDPAALDNLAIDQAIDTPADQISLVTQPDTPFAKSWNSLTPKISVEAKLTADTLAYASWSQGFKGGGFNSRLAATAQFSSYDPEKLTTYEVGLKNEFFDRRVRLNLAAFYSDYKNVQLLVLRVTPEGALEIATQNAAKSRLYGFEGELTAKVTPRFEINGAVGYLNNKYRELSAGAISAGVDLNDPLPQAPKWTASVGAQYEIPLSDISKLTYRVDYSYKSKFYSFAAAAPLDVQKGFSLVNMRLSYDSGTPFTAAIFANNVFNKYYYSLREDVRTSYDIALDWPAEPRVFGIELGYKF